MKTHTLQMTAACAALVWGVMANAAPVLTGIMELPDGVRFCLADDASDGPAEWLRVGDSFGEFKLVGYERESEVLTLRHGEAEEVKLSLRPAKITAESPEAAAARQPALSEEELRTLPNEVLHTRGLHRIVPGDTLSRIAQMTRVPVPELMRANPTLRPNQLRVGQILKLRGPAPQPQPATAPAAGKKPAAEPSP